MTRSIKTTTITLPPIVTRTISFWTQTFPPGPTFTFSPVPRIFPPPIAVRNDPVTSVTRTIAPSPYPTSTQGSDNDDDYDGPFPIIVIDIGTPGITCPFRPLDMSGPEPTERGPTSSEQPDLSAGPYPGPYESGNSAGGGGGGGGGTDLPTNTQRLWVFYLHYIDEIDNRKEWFFVHRPLDGSRWYVCDEGNDVECPSSNARCLFAPEGNLDQPPWPNGQWEVTRGAADGCVYRSNGNGPGTLDCPNKATVPCRGAADTNPTVIECTPIFWSTSFYAAVYCDYS